MSEPLVVGRAIPARGTSHLTEGYVRKGGQNSPPTAEQIANRPAPPAPFRPAATLPREFSEQTPAGKALALVYELRSERKISSADRDLLLAILEPIAFAECAALHPA